MITQSCLKIYIDLSYDINVSTNKHRTCTGLTLPKIENYEAIFQKFFVHHCSCSEVLYISLHFATLFMCISIVHE